MSNDGCVTFFICIDYWSPVFLYIHKINTVVCVVYIYILFYAEANVASSSATIEVSKRRNYLAAFCKLVTNGVFRITMAVDVFKYYVKVIEWMYTLLCKL